MDVVTLGAALNGSKKYTDQVAQSLMGGVHYRGSVSYYDDLPANPAEGDSYTVKYAGSSGSVEDGTEYTWGYDTDTSDYAWISFSKNAYSKAETDVLLGGKQNAIDSTHKLSSDLVDDSSSANKFATAAQLSQIETNKTNILYNTNNGVKNLFYPTLQSTTGDHYTVTRNSDNTFTFTFDGYTGDRFVTVGTFRASQTTNYLFSQGAEGSTSTAILYIQIGSSYYYAATTGNGTVVPMTADTEYQISCKLSANSQGTWTLKPMVRLQGDSTYQSYALSNAELTAAEKQNSEDILTEQAKTTGMTAGGTDYITVGGIRVYVSTTAPTGARTGDLWIGG